MKAVAGLRLRPRARRTCTEPCLRHGSRSEQEEGVAGPGSLRGDGADSGSRPLAPVGLRRDGKGCQRILHPALATGDAERGEDSRPGDEEKSRHSAHSRQLGR